MDVGAIVVLGYVSVTEEARDASAQGTVGLSEDMVHQALEKSEQAGK